MTRSRNSKRIRIGFVLGVSALLVGIFSLIAPFAIGLGFTRTLTLPGCGGGGDPAAYGLTYDEVSFDSAQVGRPMHAFFIYGDNTSPDTPQPLIIAMPTGAAGRADRLHEVIHFVRAGYHVFAPESRGCAAPLTNTLGYAEAAIIGDALAYLRKRPDVDQARIGIHGFSAGGASAIMAAPQFEAISAVIAQGGYHDFRDEIETNATFYDQYLWFGTMFRQGIYLGYRAQTGLDIGVLSPITVIAQIAPRPILLIYGSAEPGLRGARLMQQATGGHAELWVIEGAGHGNYTDYVPDYGSRVVAFMDAALR